MATGFNQLLGLAGKQFIIYAGSATFIAGLIGGLVDVVVFLSLKTFRLSPCGFYLLIMSIANIGQMITGLLSRILSTGFDIDWSLTSLFYCKVRLYCYQVCSLLSMSCICLASIDQYVLTCSRPQWQRWSNIKVAHRLCGIFPLIWSVHNIPYIIYYNHVVSQSTGKVSCTLTNTIFDQYAAYSTGIILGKVLPIFITFSFGFLSYRNVQQIAYRTIPMVRRELDKQLTKMVLVQIAFGIFTIIPYTIVYLLLRIVSLNQDPVIAARLQLAASITTVFLYVYFAINVKMVD
ncbi:unnamed protein product [Adineta ricciae]|uniref:G-protein coupled receptors family 1 profile domain-containing protein n=1 Tax=Adineta ricciae TaxID=249248 RepID=A0A814KFC9_ADIRI|nr:unnamed protein product [Adineta ricciae]